jgi:hypothetical protein
MPVNAQYSVATLRSLAVKIAGYQRRRMFKVFLAIGILDVGGIYYQQRSIFRARRMPASLSLLRS